MTTGMRFYEASGKAYLTIRAGGEIELNDEFAPNEAAKLFLAEIRRLLPATREAWQPISTAPKDGTLFDIRRFGRRYVDCYMTAGGNIVREHDYPMVTQRFIHCTDDNTQWMPRPPDLVMPYASYGPNDEGRYIP